MDVIQVCSKNLAVKSGIIFKPVNWLVSIWYKFLLKGISEQTMAQVFQRYAYFFKKQNNIDSEDITLLFRLNSSK